MENERQHLVEQIQSLSSAFVALERDFAFHHGGAKLHASEIHFMTAVAADPGGNATSLAQRLEVTKGAVSQTMGRLVKKGVIRKESGTSNNELRVLLTPLGSRALQAFHERTAAQWKGFSDHVAGLSRDEYQVITGFLSKLRTFLREVR